jgi:DNA-binding CsgD family transcriptional regulator/tetratricopeptide (TPR) repeat protein
VPIGDLLSKARSLLDVSVFIGRARELRLLEELLAASAGPIAALITGVGGSGKSRLLAEARRLAPGSTVLSITGFESEHQVPLAAAGPLLRGLARVPSHGEALDVLLVGRTANHRMTGPTLDDGPVEPLRFFEAAHRALQSIGPALLIVDDLQWVDELSRALCHYLVRGAVETRQPLVVLAATRPGLEAESLLDSLPADSIRRVELGPLDRADALALVRALDPSLDEPAAAKVYTQAQGIPFWLEGLTRYGRSPGGLEQVLTRRLRGAGAEAATVLGALALAGRPLPLAEAAHLLELPSQRIAAAIDALGERGLVTATGGVALPAHDLVRATAAAQVPDQLRRTIHARLAAKLESDAGGDIQPLRVALEHRRAAGLPLVALAIRISTASDRRLLGTDGLDTLGAIADAADPVDEETIALHAAVAKLAHELGRHEEALRRWSLVAARAGEPRTRAMAALEASRAAYALDRPDEARELLERSRDLTDADAVLALEQATHDAAIALWLERRGSEARGLAAQAVAMARRLHPGGHLDGAMPERRAILGALRVRYEAVMQEGDPLALLLAAEEREIAAHGVGLEEKLESELALAVALRQNGTVHEAVTHFRRVWGDTRRAVLPRLTVDAGFWLGRTLMLTGALEEAEAIVDEALDLAGRVGDVPRARHRISRAAAGVWFERGRIEEAVTILERDLGGEANEHQRIVLHGDRATWAARLHAEAATEIVKSQLDAAETCAAAVGCPRCTAELLQMATEALARAGIWRAARQSVRRRARIRGSLDELDQITLAHTRALALSMPGARIEALQAAATMAGASPYRLFALWARLDLGRAYAAVGDRRAVPELEHVVAAANDSGAVTVRELAARTLRSLGVRTWRRAATGSLLTPREEEVARLVAAGVTNREAAARLFLSPKTVERHLVNLFRKLEVRNRTELAARLAEVDAKRTGFPR